MPDGQSKASGKSGSARRLRLRLAPAAEAQVRAGHPWIFASSIRDQNRSGETGELAVIYDRQDRFLAVGLFDAGSPIRVRVLHAGKPQEIDSAWWSQRLHHALKRREGLFDEKTTGCRLVHGESDGWPGLVLDRYDTTLVLKLYTAAWLTRLTDLTSLIQTALSPERIVLRMSRNLKPSSPAAPTNGSVLHGEPMDGPVIFRESGLRLEADVLRGQKTGFFLDQRENRRRIENLARNKKVLNAFSFSGGFSVYAARGSAQSVLDLDLSRHALESARRNFSLNQSAAAIARCRHETVQADTFEWLRGSERMFDLIILDPPSFAQREAERPGAIEAYERLARLGLTRLSGGGVLLACSCSAHVSAGEFFGAVRRAAAKTHRRFRELETTHHPPDHPADFPEAHYLKGIYLHVS